MVADRRHQWLDPTFEFGSPGGKLAKHGGIDLAGRERCLRFVIALRESKLHGASERLLEISPERLCSI
jgi:hypothetical protein